MVTLKGYKSIVSGKRLPAYIKSARHQLHLKNLSDVPTDELWSIHNSVPNVNTRRSNSKSGRLSLLDVKSELAIRMLEECRLCERCCEVDRTVGITGYCGVSEQSNYSFEQILWSEEAPLIPSHEIFFCGCNMRCAYCYSWETVQDPSRGKNITTEELASLIAKRSREGAININLIGGEPTVHLPRILNALRLLDIQTAVVWNSNFYMSRETMALLDGVVDLYLGDIRFGNEACAIKIGDTTQYFEVACRNIKMATASSDLIIRHLVMPGHVDCCLRPIAEWVAENLPKTPFNLMFQYAPFSRALDDPSLCRSLTIEEKNEAKGIVSSLGLNTNWRNPLDINQSSDCIGKGQIDTTIIIQPDGQVAIMHLHKSLINISQSLIDGGSTA